MTEEQVNRKMKYIIRHSPFFIQMFQEKGVPMERIDDNLRFRIKPLKNMHAQANGKFVDLNEVLFSDGKFFPDRVHFCVHELVHWLTRQAEQDQYFRDPEEVEGFVLAISYELSRGQTPQQIYQVFWPIVSDHFEDKLVAKSFFEGLLSRARASCEKLFKENIVRI